jgi:DNA (cytosine-5)-methyltransferase 1
MLENVRGLMDTAFTEYRLSIQDQLDKLGYHAEWRLLNASDFGVSQLRPRVLCVAVRKSLARYFTWPQPHSHPPKTVGNLLHDLMASRGWLGADSWREEANSIAPTLVGGSKKHGGPDLGPTRARLAWASLGVDGLGLADMPPAPDFSGKPKLTVRMTARVQGFPDHWEIFGKKTAAYRQVGNAFPPPVAAAVASQIRLCLELASARRAAKAA